MMIMKYLKRIIMGSFLLYSFNVIAVNFNIVLPINLWTIFFTSYYDLIGIIVLVIIKTIGV